MYETFRKLRLGMPVFELHGRQKQNKRMAIYFTFVEHKFAALFTTNVASRGLDFPRVDWVVQVDAPEDVPTYVHRVGRTARYKASGASLAMLMESELGLIERLGQRRIEVRRITLNPSKQLTIRNTLQSFVTEDKDLKYLAQRAFVTYMRSVYLAGQGGAAFEQLREHANDLAESYGLVQMPVIRFRNAEEREQESGDEGDGDGQPPQPKRTKLQRLKEKIKEKRDAKVAALERSTDVKHLK